MTFQQAQQVFVDAAASRWLTPAEITPELIGKADAFLTGVKDMDEDALSDIRIEFTARVNSSRGTLRKTYTMPISIYLLTGEGDISDGIRDLLLERINSTPEEEVYRRICLRYAIRARQHLDDKNMAHYLMEDGKIVDRPNKLAVLQRLLEIGCVRASHFIQFEEREEWIGPNFGRQCSQEYESVQYLMDSAVYSGNPDNVALAIKHGLEPRYSGSSYGGPTMAYVSQYAWKESYMKIAYLLVEQAQAGGKLKQLLAGEYRKGSRSTSCIEGFSGAGLVDLVALCGTVDEGKPILDCEIERHTHHVTEGERYDQDGRWQTARSFTHTISFPIFYLVGREVALYLKGAIFRNLRGDGKGWEASIYKSAMSFLAIVPPGDDDENFVPFCLALRQAVREEAAADADFLRSQPQFTESFRTRALAAVGDYLGQKSC